jgi:hypothetical protein
VSNFRREQDLLLIHSKGENVKVRNFSGEQDLLLIHSKKKIFVEYYQLEVLQLEE